MVHVTREQPSARRIQESRLGSASLTVTMHRQPPSTTMTLEARQAAALRHICALEEMSLDLEAMVRLLESERFANPGVAPILPPQHEVSISRPTHNATLESQNDSFRLKNSLHLRRISCDFPIQFRIDCSRYTSCR